MSGIAERERVPPKGGERSYIAIVQGESKRWKRNGAFMGKRGKMHPATS